MSVLNWISRCLLVSTILFVAFSFTHVDGTNVKTPKWLKGEWEGVGLQLNFPQTWPMELSVKEGKFLISYPSLDCGGEWELISAKKSQAIFKERIIHGVDKCVQGGKIIITCVDKDHISFSYFSPDSGKLEAHATLINANVIDTKKS